MRLRTLIVDDEPIARRILRQELELMEDIEIVGEATDGEQALAMIPNNNLDVVLLDVQMPVMSGLDVVKHLSLDHACRSFVIVAAYDQFVTQALENPSRRLTTDDLCGWGLTCFGPQYRGLIGGHLAQVQVR